MIIFDSLKIKLVDYFVLALLLLSTIVVILIDSDNGTDRISFFSFMISVFVLIGFIVFCLAKSFYYKIFFTILASSIYFFSTLPQIYKPDWFQYLFLLLVYIVCIIYTLNIKELLSSKIGSKSLERFIFFLYLMFLFISIFLFNYKDLLLMEGFLKISLILASFYVSGYYLPKVFIDNKDLFLSVIKLIFYVGFLSSLYGLLTLFSIVEVSSGFVETTISIFQHTNNTPFLYTFAVPCGLYLYFLKKDSLNFFERNAALPIVILIIVSSFFTYSRAGILAMVTVLVIFMFFYSKVIFTTIITLFASISAVLFKNFIISKGAASAFSRANLISAALNMLGSSNTGLLFGFGPFSARKDFKVVMESLGIIEKNIDFPHNFILFYIMQFGLITFIILAVFIFFIFMKSFKNIRKNRKSEKYYSDLLILSFTITIGIFVQSLLEDMILFPQYFIFHLSLVFTGIMVLTNSKFKSLKTGNNNVIIEE